MWNLVSHYIEKYCTSLHTQNDEVKTKGYSPALHTQVEELESPS